MNCSDISITEATLSFNQRTHSGLGCSADGFGQPHPADWHHPAHWRHPVNSRVSFQTGLRFFPHSRLFCKTAFWFRCHILVPPTRLFIDIIIWMSHHFRALPNIILLIFITPNHLKMQKAVLNLQTERNRQWAKYEALARVCSLWTWFLLGSLQKHQELSVQASSPP